MITSLRASNCVYRTFVYPMSRKLVVLGGTGFLGKRICEAAVEANFKVTSLSRSGKAVSSEAWAQEVEWKSCDIFEPKSYASELRNATDVVHSLGILLENENYKKQVNGTSLWPTSIPELPKMSTLFGKNPLEKGGHGNGANAKKSSATNFTYEMMNKYSATLLVDTYMKVNAGNARTFSYVSADRGFPMIPRGYIDSKRAAEAHIMQYEDEIRPIILRPGFMFDERNTRADGRARVRDLLQLLNCGNELLLGKKVGCVNELVRPLISTQQVAHALMAVLNDAEFKGVLSLEDMISV